MFQTKFSAPLDTGCGAHFFNFRGVARLGTRSAPLKPSKTQKSYFRIAEEVSNLSDHPQTHLGCVLVDRHRVISSGYNSYTKCDPLQLKMDLERFGPSRQHRGPVHAETACLLPLIKQRADLSRSELYIVRKHKDGSLALSRPCSGCMSLLRAVGIRRVFFTVEGGYAVENI